jgi:hypothetical protein
MVFRPMIRAIISAGEVALSVCFLLDWFFFWICHQTAAVMIRERIAVTGRDAELFERAVDRQDWFVRNNFSMVVAVLASSYS